jgi:hypothetical protein
MDRSTAPNAQPQNLAKTLSSNCGRISLAAAEGAQALVNRCRLRKDIPDPREFWLAIAYVLNKYDPVVIRIVTDPVTGLPGRLRYPLEIADVCNACETAMVPSMLRQQRESERVAAEAERERAAAELDERRRREVERANAEPAWPPIAACLRAKLRRATFRDVFAKSRLGTFVDGRLEIVVPAGAAGEAAGMRATIRYEAQKCFARVQEVTFVEAA